MYILTLVYAHQCYVSLLIVVFEQVLGLRGLAVPPPQRVFARYSTASHQRVLVRITQILRVQVVKSVDFDPLGAVVVEAAEHSYPLFASDALVLSSLGCFVQLPRKPFYFQHQPRLGRRRLLCPFPGHVRHDRAVGFSSDVADQVHHLKRDVVSEYGFWVSLPFI